MHSQPSIHQLKQQNIHTPYQQYDSHYFITDTNNSKALQPQINTQYNLNHTHNRTQEMRKPSYDGDPANISKPQNLKECNKGRQWFGRITQHCLRRRRQKWQQKCRVIQRQYEYMVRKCSSLKKRVRSESKRKKVQQIMRQNKTYQSQLLQKIKQQNDIMLKNRIQKLKQKVINHKMNKAQSLFLYSYQKNQNANHQRATSMQILQKKKVLYSQILNANQQLCRKERQEALKRKSKLQRLIVNRKFKAQNEFKEKWVSQLQRSDMARRQFERKKQIFESRLRAVLCNNAQDKT